MDKGACSGGAAPHLHHSASAAARAPSGADAACTTNAAAARASRGSASRAAASEASWRSQRPRSPPSWPSRPAGGGGGGVLLVVSFCHTATAAAASHPCGSEEPQGSRRKQFQQASPRARARTRGGRQRRLCLAQLQAQRLGLAHAALEVGLQRGHLAGRQTGCGGSERLGAFAVCQARVQRRAGRSGRRLAGARTARLLVQLRQLALALGQARRALLQPRRHRVQLRLQRRDLLPGGRQAGVSRTAPRTDRRGRKSNTKRAWPHAASEG